MVYRQKKKSKQTQKKQKKPAPKGDSSGSRKLPLPLEVFEVIAEHLAGTFSFRSLAHLNLACKLIREVTTAILYETVLLDTITPNWNPKLAAGEFVDTESEDQWQMDADAQSRRTAACWWDRYKNAIKPLPASFKYVKYVFHSHMCDIEKVWIPSIFPNIVAWIDPSPTYHYTGSRIWIKLVRPVSSYTLFRHILRTPVRCNFDPRERPAPPMFIEALSLADDGHIYPNDPRHSAPVPGLELRLSLSAFTVERRTPSRKSDMDRTAQEIGSLFELLKMIQWSSKALTAHEAAKWERGEPFEGSADRWYGHEDQDSLMPFSSWATEMTREHMGYFLKHFPKLVDDHPDVVRGRLRLDLDYAPSKHDLLSMTTSVRACYAKRPDLISLGRRSDLVFQLFVRGSPVHGYIRRCGYSRVGLILEIRPDRNQLGIDSEEDSEDEDGNVRPELRPWHTDVLWINNETRSDTDAAHDGLQRLVVQ